MYIDILKELIKRAGQLQHPSDKNAGCFSINKLTQVSPYIPPTPAILCYWKVKVNPLQIL